MNSPLDLNKFLQAQESSYLHALTELEAGRKKTHWMWFIFPQLAGLGSSEISKLYAIQNLAEAEMYLRHPILGRRLISISKILLKLPANNAHKIFGSPDDLKLKSCMTLFSLSPDGDAVFDHILDKFFKGEKDKKTLQLLKYPDD